MHAGCVRQRDVMRSSVTLRVAMVEKEQDAEGVHIVAALALDSSCQGLSKRPCAVY